MQLEKLSYLHSAIPQKTFHKAVAIFRNHRVLMYNLRRSKINMTLKVALYYTPNSQNKKPETGPERWS